MTITKDQKFVVLRSNNGQYVCAEGGGGHEVVANRPAVGAWEVFQTAWNGGKLSLRAFNGDWMCAEGGGGREVVANRNIRGPWETFGFLDPQPNANNSDIDRIALRANKGQFVCAEGGGGHEVVANRGKRGPWETFSVFAAPDFVVNQHPGAWGG